MVEAGLPIPGPTGFQAGATAGRLRPARAEEGVGLLWDAEDASPLALTFALGLSPAMAMPTPGLVPIGWPMPPGWDAFLWSALEWPPAPWTAEAMTGPERHGAPDVLRAPPGSLPDIPAWLPAEPGMVPPRSPELPAPLFPPPVLDGGALREVSVPEGRDDGIHQPLVTDRPADGLGWRITGGADAALLLMDPASGALRFLTAPAFEHPADADGDGRYEVIFEVRDGWGAAATQNLTITVEDAIWI